MRATLDRLISIGGLLLAVVLLVAGGLLIYASVFISNEVHDQLAAQKITMPTDETGLASLPPEDKAVMEQYAGQEMTNGEQAKAYADHFIAVHLSEIGGGLTYSQLSAKAMADPKNTALADQVATVFKGTTLRGMLLNAYGFWQMGQIALIGAIASFAAAALMLILSLAGAWHLRRTPEAAEVFSKVTHPQAQTA
jgi:hypothetical protein